MKTRILLTALILSFSCSYASAQGAAFANLIGAARNIAPNITMEKMAIPMPVPVDENKGAEFNYVDPQRVIPATALQRALKYYKEHRGILANQNYLSVIDYSQHSSKKRLYVIDMRTGAVERFLVSHGKGSDPSHSGYATSFSNRNGSNMTSLGYFRTAETYSGKHGYSLRMDGLSSTNSNARDRAIVMHGAEYTSWGGRSLGCPAVEMSVRTGLINKLRDGSLIYAYHKTQSRE